MKKLIVFLLALVLFGSCKKNINGCTDATAVNYNPNANVDDGSCIPIIYGCTDSLSFNYNPNANVDDGSCIPIIYGCTDSLSLNYNPNANTDDGSCVYYITNSLLASNGFVLNEVLYDPPTGILGDANGDGVRSANDDEFLEFVNNSGSRIDISGCKIFDADRLAIGTANHKFPANTILNPGQAVVVFGGGTPTGNFGGSLFFTSSNQVLNLNNSGDLMTFTDSLNNVLIEFDIAPLSDNPNESYTRNPDITGNFEQHSILVIGTLFSPGTRVDGSSF